MVVSIPESQVTTKNMHNVSIDEIFFIITLLRKVFLFSFLLFIALSVIRKFSSTQMLGKYSLPTYLFDEGQHHKD